MVELQSADRRYQLGELLGAGGMGRVYAAADATGASLAVKLMDAALATDPGMVARMGEEARIARRVSHRNVVRVVDLGITPEGSPFLVMERVNGTPLGAVIRDNGPLALSRVRAIALQILAGLGAIHRAGLAHGDMKSDNVLIDRTAGTDRVTIIDLGLARAPGTYPLSNGDQIIAGTPEYMPPELIRGEPISCASDVYAVGIITYEMLTGTPPFGGGTVTAVFARHLNDDAVPPSLRCEDRALPAGVERVILRALAKDPVQRYADADAFTAALASSLLETADDAMASPRRPARMSTATPTRDWHLPQRKRAPIEGRAYRLHSVVPGGALYGTPSASAGKA